MGGTANPSMRWEEEMTRWVGCPNIVVGEKESCRGQRGWTQGPTTGLAARLAGGGDGNEEGRR